jgi:tetratricopeptide (TPR) repeat protein
VPDARVEPLDQGIAAESRVPVAFPNPYAPPEEDDGGLLSPWAWALPILGLVGLGAALVSTRPGSVAPAPPPRAPGPLRVSPATLEGLLRAGKDAVEEARFEEAVAWFTQAIKLDPRLPVAHFCLGVCLAAMGRDEDAYAALRKAHRLDPAEGAYRLELARAAARLGRHQEAMQQMAPLLRLLPDLAADAGDDAAFASMRDHPRWLAMLGRL